MTHYPELPPGYYVARRPRFPWLRGGFLLAFGAFVIAFLVSGDVRDGTRALAAKAATWATELQAATEPPAPRGVPAEDFTPERPAFAAASGANVRDYPLPHADLLVELPARAPLNITGRLNVQGEWWFRVVLSDQRIGFVNQRAVAFGQPPAAAPSAAQNVSQLDPPIAVLAGRAGAKIRVAPGRNARVIVRVDPGATLTANGRRRVGAHWWYRVTTEDGREGFARDDVLTGPDGGRLRV